MKCITIHEQKRNESYNAMLKFTIQYGIICNTKTQQFIIQNHTSNLKILYNTIQLETIATAKQRYF